MLADGFYDVAISNIPFGDYKPYDPRFKGWNFLIHDYFFAAALEKAGVPCVLKVYPGQGHGGPRFNDEAARKLMLDFVEKNVPPPAAK